MSFKLTGIAALAVAGFLLLSMGMGTASATVLCSQSETTKCSAPYGNETQIKATLAPGSKVVLHTAYKTIECSKSTMVAKTLSGAGGEGAIEGNIEEITFSECNCEVKVLHSGIFAIGDISGTDNGEFTPASELTTNCTGTIFGNVHCIYLALATGTLTGGNPAKIEINHNLLGATTNMLCEKEKKLTVEYEITSPSPLYVSAS